MGSNPRRGRVETRGGGFARRSERRAVSPVCGGVATSVFKQQLREVQRGRPGTRFERYHERAKKERKSRAGVGRIVRIAIALALFAIGVVFVFIPGPAILFFFFGGALVAAEWLVVARAMDWVEVRARAVWRWGRKRWEALALPGRIAVVTIVACLSAAALWAGWMWLRR